ncbi:class I SAM-dependent methyltransferase [Methanoregula sp.]|uniref:class I SAM-dependent methyltransferase n=1 Tax=Methanoregula sp. TaxID=2052170 RepID=UPI003C737D50
MECRDGTGRAGAIQEHYDRFLAGHYLWMSGGFEANAETSHRFFATHGIVPRDTRVAIDLGAGCGFQSVPLAVAGFTVHAVDLCQPLLDELAARSHDLPIAMHTGNILDFSLWSGHRPELIVCMGDTLTHLPDMESVADLINRCHAELRPGGTCIFSFRDYMAAQPGDVDVIPVRKDEDRIFLCRLEYAKDALQVTDILYTLSAGRWSRTSGQYPKIRIGSYAVRKIMAGAGFSILYCSTGSGIITVIAGKT